jgi:hypothetical protein
VEDRFRIEPGLTSRIVYENEYPPLRKFEVMSSLPLYNAKHTPIMVVCFGHTAVDEVVTV